MKTPTNLSIHVRKNFIELLWDNTGAEYVLTRYKTSIKNSPEVLTKIIKDNAVRIKYIDDRILARGQTYFYTVSAKNDHKFGQAKPFKVIFQPNAPLAIRAVRIEALSQRSIAIDWSDYLEDNSDIGRYDVFIENKSFRNIANLLPKLSINTPQKSCVFQLEIPEPALYCAVVPVSVDEKRVSGVIPTQIDNPWKDLVGRSSSLSFSLSPGSQYENQKIVVDISLGEPDSTYHILIDEILVAQSIMTDGSGNGRATVVVPSGVGPGRHDITVDNQSGSVLTNQNYFLVPYRLSPTENDDVDSVLNTDITSGYDATYIDKIRFESTNASSDTVAFRFRKNFDPVSLRIRVCDMLALLYTGALKTQHGDVAALANIPVAVLPAFSYPPFLYNQADGSINFIGLVQQTRFETAEDWVNHMNGFHSYHDGLPRVIKSLAEFDPTTQKFNHAIIDVGSSYEGNFTLSPGRAYFVEVREPVTNYCISGDGFVTFAYLPMPSMLEGGINPVVLVAKSTFTDAQGWADDINAQHFAATNSTRVVTSITPWKPDTQNYGISMIDIGNQYEGNFTLTAGHGYLVELKQTVSSYILTGDKLTEAVC